MISLIPFGKMKDRTHFKNIKLETMFVSPNGNILVDCGYGDIVVRKKEMPGLYRLIKENYPEYFI